MKNKKRKSFAAALVLFLSLTAVFAQNKISVRLPTEATIETSTIKLGDIAEISGSGESAERMKNIALGYAPNVGMTRDLTLEKIRLAITASGFTPNDFSLVASPTIRIRRAGQEITQNQFKEAVETAVSRLFSNNESVSAKIVRLDLPALIEVPTGKIDVRVNLSSVRNYFAAFSAPIEIRVNDTVIRRLAANVEIEAFADVLIAVRDLSYGEKVNETSVRLENRRLVKPLADYLQTAEKLRGLKLIKNIPNGTEITRDSFTADSVIRFGDPVRIVGESGKLQISVAGEARANGKIGDRIAVKNLQSNATLQAVVVDAGLVKVLF